MEIALQFDSPGVPKAHKMWFILISKLKKIAPINDIKFDTLHQFVEDHEEWCEEVSRFVLGRKNMSWKRFKKTWLADAYPLDEIGVTFFARCFKRHICILFNTHFWTTHKDNDPKQCSIFLAYQGNMVYEDTVPMTKDEYKASAEAIGRIQAKFDEKKLREEGEHQPLRRSKCKRNIIESDDEEIDLESLLEKEDPPVKPAKKAKADNNLQKPSVKACSVSVESLDSILKRELKQSVKDANKKQSKTNEVPVIKNRTEIPVLNIASDNEEKKDIDDKPVENKNNVQKSAPKNRSWNMFKKEIMNKMQKRVTVKVITGRKSVVKAKQKRKDSWHAVTDKGKHLKKKKGLFKCLVKGCKLWRKSKYVVRCHIKKEHPQFCWKCRVCIKTFASHQGRYKHELRHKYRFRYDCKECHYRCMFEGEMEEHVKKHSWKKLWKCGIGGCDKSYPAKRTRNAHEKTHTARNWVCAAKDEKGKTCGQDCVSKNHLKQHMHGFHGPGWTSRCGEHFKWPGTMYSHEKECTPCKKIKRTQFKKPPLK